MSTITIRRGAEADLGRVHELIVELAIYERAPAEVTNTLADMRRDGFGPDPIFGFFVAETAEQGILGIALFYTAYSTWKGRMLFLEDLVVTEAARGTGIGRKLFDAVVAEARRTNAYRLKWQVLDWNEPAIGFYKRIGANLDPEWLNGNLSAEQLQAYRCDSAVVEAVGAKVVRNE
ncbi:GNAT family N-acetyltransferase [Hymenobacter algoricola]|uniref:GNAT family N-acetyltransferase n=1 Tax=Hymenobacter algoricola TaxID=486267 RepID=A0ABP7NNP0_9BACT